MFVINLVSYDLHIVVINCSISPGSVTGSILLVAGTTVIFYSLSTYTCYINTLSDESFYLMNDNISGLDFLFLMPCLYTLSNVFEWEEKLLQKWVMITEIVSFWPREVNQKLNGVYKLSIRLIWLSGTMTVPWGYWDQRIWALFPQFN